MIRRVAPRISYAVSTKGYRTGQGGVAIVEPRDDENIRRQISLSIITDRTVCTVQCVHCLSSGGVPAVTAANGGIRSQETIGGFGGGFRGFP